MATPAAVPCSDGEGTLVWTSRAACRGAGVDPFFTTGREGEAKAICSMCLVRQECLTFALTNEPRDSKEDLGIYGGLTYDERRRMRRRKWRYGDG